MLRRVLACLLLAVPTVVVGGPTWADTSAGADITEAVGFGSGSPAVVARACTGVVVVAPTVTATTLPPAIGVQNVAVARSTCAGSLPAGTWYSGHASYIDIGLYQDGTPFSGTRCLGQDECALTFPLRGSLGRVDVIADFHWSLAYGTWSVQEPAGCLPDGPAFAIRCTAITAAHL